MLKESLQLAIGVASHLGYMVVIPLFIFGGAGLYLDRQFAATPLYMLIGIGIAFVTTMIWIYKRLRHILESLNKKK